MGFVWGLNVGVFLVWVCYVFRFLIVERVALQLFLSHPLSSPLLPFGQEGIGKPVLLVNIIGICL